jgi:hypothetical protein
MCDPISALVGLAATAGSALFGGKKTSPPPAPAIAAQPVDNSNTLKPTVQVGDANDKDTPASMGGTGFVAKRKSGTAIGGLGKSALDLNL